ncbi:MAG TPA: PIN domain-containing protein [Ramlibacter sp.]|nr:PIN domain-containing protein [Ramlibacter sp.]
MWPRFATNGIEVAGARKTSQAWHGLHEGELVVVDTAPLIYLLEDHPQFAPVFEGLFQAYEQGRIQIALSTISLAEVLVGPLRRGDDALAKRYEKALAAFELVPVTAEIAATAARLRASTGLRLPDAIQAATALELGAAALVTHDRDFSKLPGLNVLP